jgi:hypothetical protein
MKNSSLKFLLMVMLAIGSLYPSVESRQLNSLEAQSFPNNQQQSRYPTYSPGGADMRGVTIHQIRSLYLSPVSRRKAIQVELYNSTGGWYVGGWEWFLWIGNHKFRRSNCASVDKSVANIACFVFSMKEWEELKQGESVILTWGDSSEDRDKTAPITNLDKKLLDRKPKRKVLS